MLKESLLGWGGVNYKQEKIVLENKKTYLRGMVGTRTEYVTGNLYLWRSLYKYHNDEYSYFYTESESPELGDYIYPKDMGSYSSSTVPISRIVTKKNSIIGIYNTDSQTGGYQNYELVGREVTANEYPKTIYIERIYPVNLDNSETSSYYDVEIDSAHDTYNNEKFYFDKQTQAVVRVAFSQEQIGGTNKYSYIVRCVIDLYDPNTWEQLDHHIISGYSIVQQDFVNINCRQGLYSIYLDGAAKNTDTLHGSPVFMRDPTVYIYSPRYHHLFNVNLRDAAQWNVLPNSNANGADRLTGVYNLSADLDDISKIMLSMYVPDPINDDTGTSNFYKMLVDLTVNPASCKTEILENYEKIGTPEISGNAILSDTDSENYIFTVGDIQYQFGKESTTKFVFSIRKDFYNNPHEVTIMEPLSKVTGGYILKICNSGEDENLYIKRIYRDAAGNNTAISTTPTHIVPGVKTDLIWAISDQNVETINIGSYSGDATSLRENGRDAAQAYKIGAKDLDVFLIESTINSKYEGSRYYTDAPVSIAGMAMPSYKKILESTDASTYFVPVGFIPYLSGMLLLSEDGKIATPTRTASGYFMNTWNDPVIIPELNGNIANGKWVGADVKSPGSSTNRVAVALNENGYISLSNSSDGLTWSTPVRVINDTNFVDIIIGYQHTNLSSYTSSKLVGVAITKDGKIYVTEDTTNFSTWTQYQTIPQASVNIEWNSIGIVSNSSGKIVACGTAPSENGATYVSSGFAMFSCSTPTKIEGVINGRVKSNSGNLIMIGTNHYMTTSKDGKNWLDAYYNDTFAGDIVANSGSLVLGYSITSGSSPSPYSAFYTIIENGVTKTYHSYEGSIYSVLYHDNKYYGLSVEYSNGFASYNILESTDGFHWKIKVENALYKGSNPTSANLFYTNGLFYILNYQGYLYSSPDLINWTNRTRGPSLGTHGPSMFIEAENKLVGIKVSSGVFSIMYTDGDTWTTNTLDFSSEEYKLFYGFFYRNNKYYLFVGNSGISKAELILMDDLSGSRNSYKIIPVVFDDVLASFIEEQPTQLSNLNAYSYNTRYDDNQNWYAITTGVLPDSTISTGGGTGRVYLAMAPTGHVSISRDQGATWSALVDPGLNKGEAWGWSGNLIYDGTRFVALSDRGKLTTSTNGTSWTAPTAPSGLYAGDNNWWNVHGLAYGNGTYVAWRGDGVSVSTNLTNWTFYSIPEFVSGSGGFSLIFADNRFVLSGLGGILAYSEDGIHWEIERPQYLYRAACYDGFTTTGVLTTTKMKTQINNRNWNEGSLSLPNWGLYRLMVATDGDSIIFMNKESGNLSRYKYNTNLPTTNTIPENVNASKRLYYDVSSDRICVYMTRFFGFPGIFQGDFETIDNEEVFRFKYHQVSDPLQLAFTVLPATNGKDTLHIAGINNFYNTGLGTNDEFFLNTVIVSRQQKFSNPLNYNNTLYGTTPLYSLSWKGAEYDPIICDGTKPQDFLYSKTEYPMLPATGWTMELYDTTNYVECFVDYAMLPPYTITTEDGVSEFYLKDGFFKSSPITLSGRGQYNSTTLRASQFTLSLNPVFDGSVYNGRVLYHYLTSIPDTYKNKNTAVLGSVGTDVFNTTSGVNFSSYSPRFTRGPGYEVSATKLTQAGVIAQGSRTLTKEYDDEAYAMCIHYQPGGSAFVIISETERGATCYDSDDTTPRITHRFDYNGKTYYAFIDEEGSYWSYSVEAFSVDPTDYTLGNIIARVLGSGNYKTYFSTTLYEDRLTDNFGTQTPTYTTSYRLIRGKATSGMNDRSPLIAGYDLVTGNDTTDFTTSTKVVSESAIVMSSDSGQSGNPRYFSYVTISNATHKNTLSPTTAKIDANRNTQYLNDVSSLTDTTFRAGGTNTPPVVLVDGDSEPVTLTINPTPADATVTFDVGTISGNSTTVGAGTRITYTVSKTGYMTKSSTIAISRNTTLSVVILPPATLTINPTPADATVTFTALGYQQVGNSITVPQGTTVSYSVSREQLVTKDGSITMNADTLLSIALNYQSGLVLFESSTPGTYNLDLLVPAECSLTAVGGGSGGAICITCKSGGGLSVDYSAKAHAGGGSGGYSNTLAGYLGTHNVVVVGAGSAGAKASDTSAHTLTTAAGGASYIWDGVTGNVYDVYASGATGATAKTTKSSSASATPGYGGSGTSANGANGATYVKANQEKRTVAGGGSVYGGYGAGGSTAITTNYFNSAPALKYLTANSGGNGYVKVVTL